MTAPVALVTAAGAAAVDEDIPALAAALDRIGVRSATVVWDDPAVDWSAFALTVVRSTWDYVGRLPAFLDWAAAVAARGVLCNPFPVLAWNTDKRYLFDLAAAGVPVVPTRLLEPGDPLALPELASGEIVVKPVVSAGARDTERYAPGRDAEALAHAAALLEAGRAVLVQPYQPSVDTRGERSLVFVDGRFTHAIRKGAILRPGTGVVAGLYAEEHIDAAVAGPDEHAVAATAMAVVQERFGTLLYARVDLVEGPDGPRLLELELTEPSLFHEHGPGSADALAAAVAARLG